MVKASASRAQDPGFESRLRSGDFPGSSHTVDLKIGTPVATLPRAWCYKISAGTGWPGVSILTPVATRGVTVSMSAFLACHQFYCTGSSLAWGLNLRAVVCDIF